MILRRYDPSDIHVPKHPTPKEEFVPIIEMQINQ